MPKLLVSSRADAVRREDAPLLKRMRKLGCTHISMGIESGSQIMLDSMKKGLKVEQIETALSVIRAAGIRLKATFIFGFPGETRETALESVRWRLKMEPFGLYNVNRKGKFFYATPYPGSPLYDHFRKKCNLNLDEEEKWLLRSASLKDFNVNLTDMPGDELRALDYECRDILKNYGRRRRIIRKLVNKCLPRRIAV